MPYIESSIHTTQPEVQNDIVIALLAEAGYESFEETATGINAYLQIAQNANPQTEINNQTTLLNQLLSTLPQLPNQPAPTLIHCKLAPEKDWNTIWESNFPDTLVDNRCHIRAPFHNTLPNIEYEITIEPKMAFGTAHHETTQLMIHYLLNTPLDHKTAIDMGTGTGILAILMAKRNATHITAIDIDHWATENAAENISRNNCTNIDVILGDAQALNNLHADLITANINRNILLNDMQQYKNALNPNGTLIMSGFYETPDLDIIKQHAEKIGLTYKEHTTKNNWTAIVVTNE